jgi:hypothetical protein
MGANTQGIANTIVLLILEEQMRDAGFRPLAETFEERTAKTWLKGTGNLTRNMDI